MACCSVPYEWQAAALAGGHPDDFRLPALARCDLGRLERHIEKAMRAPCRSWHGRRAARHQRPDPVLAGRQSAISARRMACRTSTRPAASPSASRQSGGAGKTAAEWIAHGEPEWDFWSLDPRALHRLRDQRATWCEKAVELYQNEYAIRVPGQRMPAGRPRQDHGALRQAEGQRRVVLARAAAGKRAARFPREGDDAVAQSRASAAPTGTTAVAEECKAVRERVGILDLGGFTQAGDRRQWAPTIGWTA